MKKSSVALKSNCKRTLSNWLPFVYRGKTELGKRIACALLGAALAVGGANAWGEDLTFNPAEDITINTGDTLTVNNFKVEGNDPSKTITLNGGILYFFNDALKGEEGPNNTFVDYGLGTQEVEYISSINNVSDPLTTVYNASNGTNYSKVEEKLFHNFSWGKDGGVFCVFPAESVSTLTINNAVCYANEQGQTEAIGTLLKFNPGALQISANMTSYDIDTRKFSFTGKNKFTNVAVISVENEDGSCLPGGVLQVLGPSTYKDIVVNGPGSMFLTSDGKQDINNITVTGSAFAVISGQGDEESSVIRGKVSIDSKGVEGYTHLILAGDIIYDNEAVNEEVNEEVIEITTQGTKDYVIADVNANSSNTNIKLNGSNSNLVYSNVTTEAGIIRQNQLYITVDEYNNKTFLEWNATRDNIITAEKWNYVNNKSISGTGNISICTYDLMTSDRNITSNGYTVIMDNGKYSEFSGFTYITQGTLVLKGGTAFGSAQHMFEACGEEYELDKTRGAYEVKSAGELALYRGDETNPEVAPLLKGQVINFTDGKDGGARIWLDASLLDSEGNVDSTTTRKVGAFSAHSDANNVGGEIVLGNKTNIWWDRISTVASHDDDGNAVTSNFNLSAANVFIVGVNPDTEKYEVHSITSENKNELGNLFKSELIKVSVDYINNNVDNKKEFTIQASAVDASDYASKNNLDSYAIKGAQQIDNSRLAISNVTPFLDALYNEDNAQKVQQTFHNIGISNGLTNAVNQTHLGSAGSQFFGGAMADATSSVTTRGQSKDNCNALRGGCGLGAALDGWTVWATPSYTSIKADGYVDQGLTKDGYRVNRAGFLAGIRRQYDEKTSGGFIFAYTGPEMDQAGAYEGWGTSYKTEIEMSDYQVAMHLEHVFCEKWEAALFFGTGAQYLDWDRSLYVMNEGAYNYKGDTKGNTFTFTAYLARPIEINDHFVLRPTIGLDSEHSWLYGFDESGTDESAGGYASVATQRMHYDKIGYSRNMARIGLVAGVTSDNNRLSMSGRLFYGVALGGDDAASVHTVGLGDGFDFGNVEGYAMGNESLNLGYGLFYYLNEEKTLSASADYNAILYDNATTQNVTAGIQYKF